MKVWFDPTRMPNADAYGNVHSLNVVYETQIWGPGVERNHIPTGFPALLEELAVDGRPVCFDLETSPWWSPKEPDLSVPLRRMVIALAREYAPNLEIGFFANAPSGGKAFPIGRGILEREWTYRNMRAAEWALKCDVIYPSFYSYYGDPSDRAVWERSIQRQLEWARRYTRIDNSTDKPIRAFLTPWVAPESTVLHDPDVWWRQLHMLEEEGDVEVVVWQLFQYAKDFTGEEPWFKTLLEFAD